jgi:beta-phosphoglucomutase
VTVRAAIFDLDGVLTDTAELHYQSWQALADELGLPFDRQANEGLRGLSREQSLARVLGDAAARFPSAARAEVANRKNDDYLKRVAAMTPADAFPGSADLLRALREAGFLVAIASSSRNARVVIKRLGIAGLLHEIVDGNDAPRSKPDPQVFLVAAERLGVPARHSVVVEDAASGVEGALAAGMRVIGIGPPERVGRAHFRVGTIAELRVADFERLLA